MFMAFRAVKSKLVNRLTVLDVVNRLRILNRLIAVNNDYATLYLILRSYQMDLVLFYFEIH